MFFVSMYNACMGTRLPWTIVGALAVVITVLAWFLFATPAKAPVSPIATSTLPSSAPATAATSENEPLSARVSVASPKSDATVDKDFTVKGSAPGPWFFEATFPIKVIGQGVDADPITIAHSNANALGEWMTEKNVSFEATVHIDSYSGPATLVLLKDNPSGLPENDDSVSIPIVVR